MSYSVTDTASWFVLNIVGATNGVEGRVRSAHASIEKLLQEGWSIEDIVAEVQSFSQTYPDIVRKIFHLGEIFINKQPPDNLIDPDVFYYHSHLRVTSAPVKIRKDENGNFIRIEEPFFLEMKRSFSMQDLLDYWYEKMSIKPNDHIIKSDIGKFKYLLGTYYLDELLFAIDVARKARLSIKRPLLRNAFDLDRYIDEARDYMTAKKNVHIGYGINKTVRQGELQ